MSRGLCSYGFYKEQIKKELVKDVEMAILGQEADSNDKLREESERFGANPFTNFLDIYARVLGTEAAGRLISEHTV